MNFGKMLSTIERKMETKITFLFKPNKYKIQINRFF